MGERESFVGESPLLNEGKFVGVLLFASFGFVGGRIIGKLVGNMLGMANKRVDGVKVDALGIPLEGNFVGICDGTK